ncbi:MAG: hypothetical protein CM15mP12_1730 [Gammaproteobacteria bacterium]|nr:MAG: hypothetical protein CM15mP12_1730 [Gammaproteobacteria bacterium]
MVIILSRLISLILITEFMVHNHKNDKGYKAIFTSIEEGVIYEDKNIMVTAF